MAPGPWQRRPLQQRPSEEQGLWPKGMLPAKAHADLRALFLGSPQPTHLPDPNPLPAERPGVGPGPLPLRPWLLNFLNPLFPLTPFCSEAPGPA